MDFNDTPEEAAFRAKARAWLEPPRSASQPGEAAPASRAVRDPDADPAGAGVAGQEGRRRLGLHHWPKEYGGRGATPIQSVIWHQEERATRRRRTSSPSARACRPDDHGPRHAEQKERYLRPACCAARRSGASCSPSRPPAPTSPACAPARCGTATTGSSTARRSGPPARTTRDYGMIVTRTDPTVAKHQGLTILLPRHEVAGHRDPADQADQRRVGTSTRCSSPTCAFPTASALGAVGEGWRVRADDADERAALRSAAAPAAPASATCMRLARDADSGRPAGHRRTRPCASKLARLVHPAPRAEVHELPHA